MSSTDLQASWNNFSDSLSGIEFYEYGVGTTQEIPIRKDGQISIWRLLYPLPIYP